jgi:hypothetical protein
MLLKFLNRRTLKSGAKQVNPDVGIHNLPWEAHVKPQVVAVIWFFIVNKVRL